MDLTDPTRAVTGTLDGPVLAVLSQAGRPLTVGEVAAQAVRGSEIGIRRSLSRLTAQGIVRATEMGRNRVHELNREHIAAPVADVFAGLRLELWKRLRDTLARWDPQPLHASVFGSAARGDGDTDSDIDVLLVHRPMQGERQPRRGVGILEDVVDLAAKIALKQMAVKEAASWRRQVDELYALVPAWTGNSVQVVDLSVFQWMDRAGSARHLLSDVDRDAVLLAGVPRVVPPKRTGPT